MENRSIWNKYSEEQLEELEKLNAGYMDFLSECKTERECVERAVRDAEEAGYRKLDDLIDSGEPLKAGDKVYRANMGKSLLMFNIGDEPLCRGMNILGAHIDSPRMDVKQNPLYEDSDLAYLDTHYYGGIKKYLYVTIPLALHGVFVKKDGTKIRVAIGEDPADPVFFISDILIHLAHDQMNKRGNSIVEGEALDLCIGNRPLKIGEGADADKDKDETKEKAEAKDLVKRFALKLLKDKYGVEEEDFISAELEVVPAGRAREAGLDRSMILAYGQDDRVCAYTSYRAMLDVDRVKRTACCILVDKEEIGSVGATGMQSRFFEDTVAEVVSLYRKGKASEGEECCGGIDESLAVRRCLANSNMLSSDVNAGYDPLYPSPFEKKNTSFLGRGPVFSKFTGSGGKYDSNDANAEYIALLRNIFDKSDISYQFAELGKVDAGGGGTIAYILALYGMNVIDAGVAVLSMHSPWEATSKADVYEALRGYKVFLEDADLLEK
ncbi:MAG: aminopeptidase [Eubacterium sp.]|nr:aminopeptidase [Eubacterium sp.]